MYTEAMKQRAYILDPECWISYSGMSPEHKRKVEVRRTASLEQAAKDIRSEIAEMPGTAANPLKASGTILEIAARVRQGKWTTLDLDALCDYVEANADAL